MQSDQVLNSFIEKKQYELERQSMIEYFFKNRQLVQQKKREPSPLVEKASPNMVKYDLEPILKKI